VLFKVLYNEEIIVAGAVMGSVLITQEVPP